MLETLVSRLKTQLSSKEKRIAQLKDAVRELEKKLGDALTRWRRRRPGAWRSRST